MLFFVFLIIIGIIIISNLRIKQIMQRCDDHINQICDNGEDIQHPEKIPVYISFLKKHSIRITKLIRTNSEFQKKLENFDYKLNFFVNEIIRKKRDSLYRQQLSTLLTHTIKDKDLKKQIITEIKNSEYIPKIENNEEEHFTYNLLNHYVHKGNPVDGEKIEIIYPDVLENINLLSLKYLKDNKDATYLLLSELHRVGRYFAERNDFFTVVKYIITHIDPKEPMNILKNLKAKKIINSEQAEIYKKEYDEYVLKNNRKNNDKLLKKWDELQYGLYFEYVCDIIKNGAINEYIWLSNTLERLLFCVDSPRYYKYYNRSWLISHKKMLDARIYGINPLLLFNPKEFEDYNYLTETIIKFKQDIDTILSAYYPVPNFLNHAKEILDAYITGNSFCKQIRGPRMKSAGWYDDYNRKLCDIQLADLSPYEFFGFSTGYLENSLDFEKRIYIQYDYILRSIKDIAFKAYLKSMDDEIFDKAYEYCWEQIKNIEVQNGLKAF